MKSKIIPIALLCVSVSVARADFNPVAISSNSYTYGIVVPSNTVPAVPECVNAFSGSGLCLTCDNTFYEQGLYARYGTGANSGIPTHNTVFTNINNSGMPFLMPPSYLTNNDLMIVNGTYGSITSGTFTFNTPTAATSLALLCTDGNGGMTVGYTVTHADTTTESGSVSLLDWFNGGGSVAWGANGRMDDNGNYNNFNSSSQNNNAPYLYANKIAISNSSPILSITFNYTSGGAVANFYAVSGSTNGATYTPISVTGFNVIGTIPATIPFPVTATMDNGTNVNSPGNTWFEQGYYTTNTSYGVPPSGSVFNSLSQPTHHYRMGNYSNNNAVLIDINHLSANITLTNPAPYFALSFLTAGANISGTMNNICILQHQDGVNETNTFFGYDWFNTSVPGAIAWEANGRVNLSNRTLNNLGNTTPNLFESYFPLTDTTSPVTNILVKYGTAPSGSSTTYIMAVSASSVPVAPVITQEPLPTNQTWFPSQTATISVLVSGTAPITNYWFVESNGVYVPLANGVDVNGSTITGAGTTTLSISDLTLADGTNYEYAASNAVGGQISAPASVTINTGAPVGPIIDSQIPNASISSLTVFTNVPNKTNLFSVTVDASSSPPISYQWYRGVPQSPANAIPNATNATYASVDVANVTISCIVSNFVGTATNSPVTLVAGTLSAYQAALLAYKPVAYWPLNETSGTEAFDYFGNNNGTYEGNYQLDQPGIPATGGIGTNTSVAFDGSTAYVDIPVNNLNITGPITVIAWAQTPAVGEAGGHFGTVVGHSDSSYRMTIVNTAPRFTDSGPDDVGTADVGDGNWHQLVGVYDGVNQYIYADGQLTGAPLSSTPSGSADDVWIAGAPDYPGARNFNGNIAQVSILTNALTAAQVAALYYSLEIPPTVSITPANPSIYAGSDVTLTAQTNGSPPLRLQWYSIDTSNNSNNIPGATNAAYTISNASIDLSGYTYGINVTNAYGAANSSVSLNVQNGPPYLQPGGDISILYGQAYVGAPVTYTVNASGSAPLSYQWIVNGQNVSGATNSSFTVPAGCGTNTVQVAITNSFSGGSPTLSSLATIQGEDYPTNVTFNTNGAGWQLNSDGAGPVPSIANNVLELTSGLYSGEASSAFYYLAQYVGTFEASFTYTAGDNAAGDGAAFILQDSSQGTNALGGSGGDLGYFQIEPSIALEIDLYNAVGIAPGTNGITYGSTPPGLLYGPTGQVHVNSGDPINFHLNFANGNLAVTLTDATTSATYSTNYTFGPLAAILGTDLAYVGFSGGDGGATALQTISNFSFNSVIPTMMLSISPVVNNSFTLSWSASDPNWVLQQSSSLSSPNWTAGPASVVVNGVNEATVTVPHGAGQTFYRLERVVCQ